MSDAILKDWPLEPARPRGFLYAALGLALAAGLVVAALSVLAGVMSHAVPQAAPPALPEWTDIQKPVPMFSLEAPVLDKLPTSYAARRRSVGNGRQDVLAFGALAGDAPALRLDLSRNMKAANAPLFATLAREAADVGLSIAQSGLPDLLTTRFGKFEIADIGLARTATGVSPCSGFRLVLAVPAFAITGLACGAPGHAISRNTLACLIDRLDLASAAADHALIDFFAATELTRNPGCTGAGLGPDGLHAAWLDDKQDGDETLPGRDKPKAGKTATSRKSLRRR